MQGNLILLMSLLMSSFIFAQKGKINTNNSSLRSHQNIKSNILTKLQKGDVCTILSVGRFEHLDNYGNYPWLEVETKNNQVGFIYGALVDIINDKKSEINLDTTGYVRDKNTNVRLCGNLQCGKVFQLPKGVYCKVLSKTEKQENIGSLGKAPWYFIEVKGRRGYIFGKLITLETNQLIVDSTDVEVYDQPNGQVVQTVNKGEKFKITKQSEKSELIRPYGRHYWYKIDNSGHTFGWVFGVFTSKSDAPVDCQCVDYVKNVLSITGPTKNAFEWEEVLYGQIPVTIDGTETYLSYKEIYEAEDVRKGDIAIFDNLHPEADNQYGHIGIVGEKIKKLPNQPTKIPLVGGNHDVPLKHYFTKHNCNNVSRKLYTLDNNVRFFRPDNKQ